MDVGYPLRVVALTALLFTFSWQQSNSQPEAEGYSTSYLNRNFSARSLGMGGAYTSIVNEPNAVLCNPGALSRQSEDIQASAMFSALSFGRSQSSLCVTKNLSSSFGLGIGLINRAGDSFTRRDASGTNLGESSYQQFAACFGLGYTLGSASFGACAKVMQNTLSGEGLQARGFAFDLGAVLPFAKVFNFGLCIQNVGSMTWNNSSSTSDQLAWIIRSGISTEISLGKEEYVTRSTSIGEADTLVVPSPQYILLSLEADYIRDGHSPLVILGAEYSMTELFAFRGGVSLVNDVFGQTQLFPFNVLSGGLCYRIHAEELPFRMQLDYAARHDVTSAAGISHHVSLTIGF